jgi:ornithine cyclodeaminase/alanine dehydrogenase-like protein (mu-crystallin family)
MGIMRVLSAADVSAAVTMKDVIGAVWRGFAALSAGDAAVPLRAVLETPGGAVTFAMPAHVHGEQFTAVKVVSLCPDNPGRGLPAITGMVMLIDAATGEPLALMDGAFVTALRTGAASGVATNLLARPDASVLGVIGAGVQARTQIAAVRAVRDIREVRVYSLAGAEALVDELAADLKATVAASAAEALRGADVVVAATTSKTPVVHAADLSAGAHINGVGSFKSEMQEVAADVVRQARLVIDSREGALAEAGDLIIPLREGLIHERDMVEIGEVIAGAQPGRRSPDEITFFKSVGNAVQDAVTAGLVYEAAVEQDLGQQIAFEVTDPGLVGVRIQ